MSFVWPEHKVDLAEAATLFGRYWESAGEKRTVHRSSLSRFVSEHHFPHELGKRGAKLIDAKTLFDAYTSDFTRQVMAGETGSAPRSYSPAASSSQRPSSDDPKYRRAQIDVIDAELDLAQRLNQTAPVEEISGAAGEAIAVLRSAQAEARADTVSRLLQLFGRPESDARLVRDVLKRHDRVGQEKFAEALADFLTPEGQKSEAARARLARAEAIAAELAADQQA